jgi:hypothetical protein
MKVDFSQGAYTARSVTADAQRQINLYAEPGSPDSPHKVSLYPTPGLQLVADYTGTITGRCRGLHWAAGNLQLYAVFGVTFVRINSDWTYHLIGTLTGSVDTGYPVSMSDNGTTLVIVDGRIDMGWTYGLLSGTYAQIVNPAFFGSTRVDYIDTYFIFQHLNTQQFYISDSLATTFNPLWFAGKVGYSDLLVSVAALHDAVWLFGEMTTEIWFNSGAADFPFQRMGGSVLQFGCASTYSVVVAGNGVYWMSQDRHGRLMFLRGEGYEAKRVSNFAVEQAWSQYNLNAGAIIAMVYQSDGHEFIVIQFTNVGQTWVLDATTTFWHQRQTGSGAWSVGALAFWKAGGFGGTSLTNSVVAGDSTVAKLYTLERTQYTDNGVPITRLRSWPHVLAAAMTQAGQKLDGQQRVSHHQFVTAMSGTSLAPDQISLRWSDDGGQTFGAPVVQTTNNASYGQYSWRRLGMARDRVYELSWTATGETALNGAWVEIEAAGT